MHTFIDHHSTGVGKTELDLFSVPGTVISNERSWIEDIFPTHAINNSGPYEFRIPPDPNMLQICNNHLYIVLQLVDAGGEGGVNPAGPNDAPVWPAISTVNLLPQAFIENVDVYIGGNLMSSSNNLYPYRSFMEVDLNYGSDAKSTHLKSAFFYPDEAGKLEDGTGTGFRNRRTLFAGRRKVEMMIPLHVDFFEQHRYILDNTDIRIVLKRCKDPFLLICPTPPPGVDANATAAALAAHEALKRYRFNVVDLKMRLRKVQVQKGVWEGVEQALVQQPACYPIRRIEMKTQHIATGLQANATSALFTGRMPRRMVVALVDTRAYYGEASRNPFNFQHFNIRSAKLVAGGQTYPEGGYRYDWNDNIHLESYMGLMDVLGICDNNRGNQLDPARYQRGSFFIGFDLTADSDDGPNWQPIKDGTVYLHLEFATPIEPPLGVTIIIYMEHDGLITLDRNRQVTTDYTA